jgi:hypothetical protein
MNGIACQAGLVLSLCTLLCGCGAPAEPMEQTVKQTHRIDPHAEIDITNRDGSIQVYGSDQPELYVEATKKAYTKKRLDGIAINLAAQRHSVSITTTFPARKEWGFSDRSGTVDYVVLVPAGATISRLELENGEILVSGMEGDAVRATLGSGRLFARNCFANMHFRVGTGALALIYDWWEQRKFSVEATIQDGKASATMPGDASFHLVAESPNGRITNDFADQEQRNESTSQKTDMVAGETPNAEMKIRAHNGNIQVMEANP